MNNALLRIQGLRTYFYTEEGVVRAADGVDLEIFPGETLGLVGESGCGKTVTAKSILRLIPDPPGRVVEGSVFFEGRDLLKLDRRSLRREIRGNRISMIFQDPMTSLNPVYTVGEQVSEAFRAHRRIGRARALRESVEILGRVGIASPERMVREYPHRYSGGMRQRAMIAMALACRPALLLADEPSTALDVTIQAQILELMKHLREEFQTSILLITHNLGVVAEMADRVAVMYAGQVVEKCGVERFFDGPAHPYATGLLHSFPGMARRAGRLDPIPGSIPDMVRPPEGCRFHPRCRKALPRCTENPPPVTRLEEGHLVRCWLYE
ncbi:MAG: ABC transporter ATP-binding protein [Deltaproteobacteria bacterium]|nr:ABC transporter ATP-binding protein [Deltaproteobacteria bacterium]MBW1923712.1 ABC transporter ATP-binding protein [Deltaproteobacteria bacterium]MBW1950301.1 ABC transporter ATP-binding protein [Deltaproteobacteria bacterium]MBW2009672.1 ABC transporter ATP-binding protein [Deltaproteobacteria bacterium]MBW2102211.1 ABC transporter ATP-binding protein [Deltaproteobacteria bacterium]